MRHILARAGTLGAVGVVSSVLLVIIAQGPFGLGVSTIQTLLFLKLSVAGHVTYFMARTRGPFWSSRPAAIVLVAVVGTQLLATAIALTGLLMPSIGLREAALAWGWSIAWLFAIDRVKVLRVSASRAGCLMSLRFTLVGVGAMNSPRYRPAGLLLSYAGRRVLFDGGPGAGPGRGRLDAWLVTDERAELIREIRSLADAYGVTPRAGPYVRGALRVRALPVAHTSHPTYGYLIELAGRRAVWAPEFWEFPSWAAGADVMFADAAAWTRPIRFAGGIGGHAAATTVADDARRHGIRRLVLAHIGRPAIRARDAGESPAYGEWGHEGRVYIVR